jgi:hypothetical protein
MEFVAVRDFRVNPGKIWKKLKKERRMVVTSNGKPIAILNNIENSSLEDELRMDILSKGMLSVNRMRVTARQKGLDKLPAETIDAEIKATRNYNN